jgi:hypothetical protein
VISLVAVSARERGKARGEAEKEYEEADILVSGNISKSMSRNTIMVNAEYLMTRRPVGRSFVVSSIEGSSGSMSSTSTEHTPSPNSSWCFSLNCGVDISDTCSVECHHAM